MDNIWRLIAILIYPCLVAFLIVYLIKTRFKDVLKNNWKSILISLIILMGLLTFGLIRYYSYEDCIYVYDNSGYYIKSLEMAEWFWSWPKHMFWMVIDSINNSEYSYLPALFNFYGVLINNSYLGYCLINAYIFLLPSLFLLELLYYKYFNNKIIPTISLIAFYPLWITIYYGRVDVLGIFLLIVFYIITFFTDYKKITIVDTLILNGLCVLLMFERRWFLYMLVGAYLAYLVKAIVNAYKNKDWLKSAIQFICSGVFALIFLLLFFRTFIYNTLFANNLENFTYYNTPGKFLEALSFFSYLICLISLYGLIKVFIKDKLMGVMLMVVIIIPAILFWQVQVFDLHHHLIITLGLLISFVYGLVNLPYKKITLSIISVLLLIQTIIIFYENVNIPGLTTVKKLPEYNLYKPYLQELDEYLIEATSQTGGYTWFATGNYQISDDAVKNSLLPNIKFPNTVYYIFDDRDGFPRNIDSIQYVVISDPIIYRDENYQHMYTVITDAITNNEEISKIYTLRKSIDFMSEATIYVYEKTSTYTKEMKQWLYDKMIEYYPDKMDTYSYILD